MIVSMIVSYLLNLGVGSLKLLPLETRLLRLLLMLLWLMRMSLVLPQHFPRRWSYLLLPLTHVSHG